MRFKRTILVTVMGIVLLLSKNNYDSYSTIQLSESNLEIVKNENEKLHQELALANEELTEYKKIFSSFNEVGAENVDYVFYDIPFSNVEQKYIQDLCNINNWSYELIIALIKVESNFDRAAISKSNCLGLMQINNRYLDFYGNLAGIKVDNPYNFKNNIKLGISYLSYLREYWISKGITDDNSLYYYVLNSYNLGNTGYKEYVTETKNYSRTYDKKITKYKKQLEANGELN